MPDDQVIEEVFPPNDLCQNPDSSHEYHRLAVSQECMTWDTGDIRFTRVAGDDA